MDNGVSFKDPKVRETAGPFEVAENMLMYLVQKVEFLEDKVALLEELLGDANVKVESLKGLVQKGFEHPSDGPDHPTT